MSVVNQSLKKIKEMCEAHPGKYSLQFLENKFDLSPVTIKKFCLENSLELGGYQKRDTKTIEKYVLAHYKKQTAHEIARQLGENVNYIRNLCVRLEIIPKGTKSKKDFSKRNKNFLDYDDMRDPIF